MDAEFSTCAMGLVRRTLFHQNRAVITKFETRAGQWVANFCCFGGHRQQGNSKGCHALTRVHLHVSEKIRRTEGELANQTRRSKLPLILQSIGGFNQPDNRDLSDNIIEYYLHLFQLRQHYCRHIEP